MGVGFCSLLYSCNSILLRFTYAYNATLIHPYLLLYSISLYKYYGITKVSVNGHLNCCRSLCFISNSSVCKHWIQCVFLSTCVSLEYIPGNGTMGYRMCIFNTTYSKLLNIITFLSTVVVLDIFYLPFLTLSIFFHTVL